MDFTDILSITGLGGLYKLVANRPNGLMVVPIEGGKRKFVSVRKHQFTPLESIAIYTVSDSTPLRDVLLSMQKNITQHPLPDPQASSNELATYFKEILPEYDPYRVHTKDIKKVVKWYKVLDGLGMVTEAPKEEEKKEEEEKTASSEEE